MKRRKTLIILAAVIAALVGIVVVEKTVTRHVDKLNTTDEIVFTADQDALTQVSVTEDDATLTLAKNDEGTWYSTDDETFPIDQDSVAEFLDHFAEVHASFIIDDIDDYSQYGLDKPTATVTFTTEDGDTTVSLGGYSTMDEKRYITTGADEVYLVDDDLLDYIDTERDSFMQNDTIPEVDTVNEVTFSGDTELDLVYDPDGVYSYTDAYDYYALLDGEHCALDSVAVQNLTGTLTGLTLTDYVTYNASTADLSQWGLDAPAYTVTVTGTAADEDGNDTDVSYTLYIGTVTTPAASEDEDPTVTGYARLGESEIVYTLSDSNYNAISSADYNSLRPGDVLSLDWDTVTAVDVTYDGTTYNLVYGELPVEGEETETDAEAAEEPEATATPEPTATPDASDDEDEDDGMGWMLNGQEVHLSAFKAAADDLWINTFTDEKPDKTQELALTFTLDNEAYSTVTVTVYRYDGDNCLVLVNGEPVGLMARSLMVDLREAMTSIVLTQEG